MARSGGEGHGRAGGHGGAVLVFWDGGWVFEEGGTAGWGGTVVLLSTGWPCGFSRLARWGFLWRWCLSYFVVLCVWNVFGRVFRDGGSLAKESSLSSDTT